jgi:hypothetical protein
VKSKSTTNCNSSNPPVLKRCIFSATANGSNTFEENIRLQTVFQILDILVRIRILESIQYFLLMDAEADADADPYENLQ